MRRRDFLAGSGLLFLPWQPGQTPEIKAKQEDPPTDQRTQVLAKWSAGLLQSPLNTQAIAQSLSSRFIGSSWKPVDSRLVRPETKVLVVRRLTFASQVSLASSVFLSEAAFKDFSSLLTADFQITRVEGPVTRIHYELVGTGPDFYREQRVGDWSVEWEEERVVHWQLHDETRSRSTAQCFADVTRHAFGKNSSFEAQMMHGADYWRMVLDGATGVDIYGHNGVSVGDLTGSGHDDVYVCQAAGLPNRLYRNRGDGTFEDISEGSGVNLLDNTACALIADFNNDGRQDLVVVRAAGPLLFLNQGNGKFKLKPNAFRFANPPQGTFTGAAAADYNRDGLLDIYFCLYSFYQGADQYNYPTPYFAAENGPPNFLLRNNGDGTFDDVTPQTNNTRYSFCCGWGDYNGDGWPDLYVVNDFGRKNLYRNNGDGTFTDVAKETGVEDVGAGMSVCWFDYNNDGKEDIYVANMWTAAGERISHDPNFQKAAPETIRALYQKHAMGNSLLRNDGNGFGMVEQAGMGRWSWSSDAWDFDHDGLDDLYVTNGMISGAGREDLNSYFWQQVIANSPNEARPAEDYEQGWKTINERIREGHTWSGYERNVVYANNGDGTFSDVSGALGLDFIEDGRSFALADFDGDGRQELLLKNRNAPQIRLIKNIAPDLPPAIAFRLTGTKSNRDAIGAVISVGQQTKSLQAGSGFLSQHSKELFFGLGNAKEPVNATIHWPSGFKQELKDLPPNHCVWVTEGETVPTKTERLHSPTLETVEPLPAGEQLPETFGTTLLAPVSVPSLDLKPGLLTFTEKRKDWDIYNLLFRTLFDYHRDMPFPTSFLIDGNRQIVAIYQGAVTQRPSAVPFSGVKDTYEYGRNYLSLGSIFFQRGYIEAAGDFFQSVLKESPDSAEAFYGLGSVYLKQDRNTQARDCFERVVKLKASYPETTPNAWNNLGILATREGDVPTAIDYFQKALSLNPDHFVALENLGSAYRQQKRWDEARTTFEKALTLKTNDAEANYGYGIVLAQSNDTTGAYEHLRKALEERPAYPEALNNLGILYLRTRRRGEAVAQFEQCIRVAPTFDQAYLNLAKVYAIEGNKEKARSILGALLKQHPDHAGARQALEQLR